MGWPFSRAYLRTIVHDAISLWRSSDRCFALCLHARFPSYASVPPVHVFFYRENHGTPSFE